MCFFVLRFNGSFLDECITYECCRQPVSIAKDLSFGIATMQGCIRPLPGLLCKTGICISVFWLFFKTCQKQKKLCKKVIKIGLHFFHSICMRVNIFKKQYLGKFSICVLEQILQNIFFKLDYFLE